MDSSQGQGEASASGTSTEVGGAKFNVNGSEYATAESNPTGRDALAAAGFQPPDEHVLISVLRPGTRSIGLEEHIARAEEFYAFRADRSFNFTIEGKGYEWGASKISEALLRDLSGIADDMVLTLERNGQQIELDDGQEIDLGGAGTEHLRSRKELVTVCFNGAEVSIPRGTYSTEQLMVILGVEPGYLLNMLNHKGELETLKPGQKVKIRKGIKFISQAPCGGSS